MVKQKLRTKDIALMGLLMALQLIFTRFLSIETPFLRIGFSFIPTVIMGIIFGPLLTGVGSTLSDFIGISLFAKTGPYFPGFSLSAFLGGAIYGYFFYKKEITLKRVILAKLVVSLVVSLLLNTTWLYMMMGQAALVQLPIRIVRIIIGFPIEVFIIYYLGNHRILKQQIQRFQKN
ncbi:folate family ECF transporter S component [Vagococcus salmoninarum]|uniref:Folate transporter n=1 Tax=Vagococcus salmoninarum TaxID=2739 RepID=A0A429ZIL1_9ENTE|nr:folate family ECF transporter S component [Vagococcus salmoninarum]RST93523.1 hypothetical protein CBF35_11400 [Vagococcus salmoninarum]